MTGICEPYIVDYLRGLYSDQDPFLLSLEEYAARYEVPIIERESLALLELMVNLKNPKRILEIGTAIGYSTIAMAKISSNVIIDTIDIDEENLSVAQLNIAEAGYDNRIFLHYGDASDVLDNLKEKYDMVFIDAAKSHYREYFDKCLNLVNDNALIISDNVLFKGLIANDELVNRRARTLVRAMRNYLEFLTHTKGLSTSVLPVGDGVAITKIDLKELEIEPERK
ncbi:O-methyltransferase [Microaceticoccus formicicus]|uniref:O-methyltransferase n=1 Tax=Microaceticoccus formicicus TaxID=3118105 RepID=UPI003CCFFD7B|nr:O-methyltransferase [Peptoniphilaceae bacterium AMB_02]